MRKVPGSIPGLMTDFCAMPCVDILLQKIEGRREAYQLYRSTAQRPFERRAAGRPGDQKSLKLSDRADAAHAEGPGFDSRFDD